MGKKPFFFSARFGLIILVSLLIWGFHSGRLLYTGQGFCLASYTVPSGGPTAEVHPEVLNLQSSFSNVAELVKPAVVNIATVQIEQVVEAPMFYFGDPFEQFFDPYGRGRQGPRTRQFKSEGVGSGVIIDPEGLVLTNEHVVRRADQIKVYLYDEQGNKKEYPGQVVGKDARTDLAVIRIKAGHKLPFARLGDSDKVRVGDWSIAIGSPFGLAQTVTVGVISAARQSLAIEDREYRNMIQTDAAINRGNSGGPLLNIYGDVIGINTAIYAPTGVFSGIGFAVPINQAKQILDDLVKKGRVVRGWLGVELGPEMTPAMIRAFGLPDARGALVNNVVPNSPAVKAGLQRGDVIRRYDEKTIESSRQLQSLVAATPPKKTIVLEIVRQGKSRKLSLTLAERPEQAVEAPSAPESPADHRGESEKSWLGARVRTVTPDLAQRARQPEAAGVIVVEVQPGSVAEDVGLQEGDIIQGVNQQPTPDADRFSKAIAKVKLAEGVVLDVLRQGRSLYLSYTKP